MKTADIFGHLPILETERTLLREIRENDAEDMFHYCSNPEVSRYTTWGAHQSIEDTQAFISLILQKYANKNIASWGVVDRFTGKLIGTCGYVFWDAKNSKAEVAYALSREYWNKGYMSEVVNRVIQFGFEEMGLVRIEARCHPDNIGSSKVMEKTGMRLEGILRKHILVKDEYIDVKMYSIIN